MSEEQVPLSKEARRKREERHAMERALHKDGRVVCGKHLIIQRPTRIAFFTGPGPSTDHFDTVEYDIYPRNGMPPLGYDRVARCKNFSEALLTVANLEKEES